MSDATVQIQEITHALVCTHKCTYLSPLQKKPQSQDISSWGQIPTPTQSLMEKQQQQQHAHTGRNQSIKCHYRFIKPDVERLLTSSESIKRALLFSLVLWKSKYIFYHINNSFHVFKCIWVFFNYYSFFKFPFYNWPKLKSALTEMKLFAKLMMLWRMSMVNPIS